MDLKYDQNVRIEDGETWAEVTIDFKLPYSKKKTNLTLVQGHCLKIIGTSAKSGDGIDAVFDDMLGRMNKGKSEFFNQKQRERGATIALNPKNIKGQDSKAGAKDGKTGKKKKKCC